MYCFVTYSFCAVPLSSCTGIRTKKPFTLKGTISKPYFGSNTYTQHIEDEVLEKNTARQGADMLWFSTKNDHSPHSARVSFTWSMTCWSLHLNPPIQVGCPRKRPSGIPRKSELCSELQYLLLLRNSVCKIPQISAEYRGISGKTNIYVHKHGHEHGHVCVCTHCYKFGIP